ncbi:MAG TPA: DCC1-like thiol-disulfide oxidoreductase family protein [Solirubrobacterales bacterium]|nr:DCC1-like thiol-disulfide oxidoreductase family protein [Solirubrobacterales bacterium]
MLVLYDGDCGFCKVMLAVLLRWDRARRLEATPIQSSLGQQLLGGMPAEDRLKSWHLRDAGGELHSGGPAIPIVLATLPRGRALARVAARFPGPTARTYQWVATHRVLLGRFLGARPRAWSTRVIAARRAVPRD